ncbi:NTP transferase domain-containing protein [Ancylobacter sp.]|uniref:NTP transferase domain-containing protein n=1 Tax=Ancylobacter sp. TaxID=1872567 RepID=UPI003D0B5CE7
MGIAAHKALVPAVAGQGTLERLLGQLGHLPAHRVTVVTGYRHEDVERLVRGRFPGARCVHNSRYESTEMLQSLGCALAPELPGLRDCWVLLADTVYSDAALAALFAAEPGGVAMAVTARAGVGDGEIPVEVRDGAVLAVADAARASAWRMAHAVRWPPQLRTRLREAAEAGMRYQWQLIAALLREETTERAFSIRAIMLPLDGAHDIDTLDDLARATSNARPRAEPA